MAEKKNDFREELSEIYRDFDHIQKNALTPADIQNIAHLSVDERYKSLVKLIDNILVDIQNKVFRESGDVEDFKAVKWTIMALNMIKVKVRETYISVTRQKNDRPKACIDPESVPEEPPRGVRPPGGNP